MISGFFDFFLLFFALSFLDFSGGSSFLLFSYAILFVLFDCFSFTLLVVDTSLVSFIPPNAENRIESKRLHYRLTLRGIEALLFNFFI